MTTFIHLPFKKTEDLEWDTPLTEFLTATFGRSFSEEITPSISQLNKLRADIKHTSISDSETILPTYLNYIIQLNSLELRLPISIIVSNGKLEFSWSDAFNSSSSSYSFKSKNLIKQNSISFEKASIIYQIASIHSYLACLATSSMDWKAAVQHFSCAAGILDFISINFLHAPTNDLKVDTTKALSKLMLAQAQECFLWNYMQSSGSLKHSLASKLSEGVSQAYKTASDLINASSAKLDCELEIKLKGSYFHTFAMHQNSQSYMDSTEIGYAIVCNDLARLSFSECKRIIGLSTKNKIDPGLMQLINEIEKELTAMKEEWEKDNDLIYNQPLPAKNNVPSIKSMSGAALIDFEKQLKTSGFKDLFDKIVPMEAHQSMSIYSEKQAQLAREWDDKVQIANEKVKSVFEFSKIPGSIIEIQNLLRPSNSVIEEEERNKDDQYPRILAIAHEVQSGAMESQFKKDMSNIKFKRDKILKQLNDADAFLLKDDRNVLVKNIAKDENLEKLKGEVEAIRRNLLEAGTSDSKLNDLWEKYQEEIDVLENGVNGVQNWLNKSLSQEDIVQQVSLLDLDDNSDATDLKHAKGLIENIYELKKSLELLMSERNSTLTDLKSSMHSEDISSVLIKYKGATEEEFDTVFTEQLSKYNSYLGRLDRLIAAQDEKIIDLKDSLNKLLDLNIVKKKVEERKSQRGTINSKLTRLSNAYDTWKLCSKGVKEALDFYSKLDLKTSELVLFISNKVNQREKDVELTRNSIPNFALGFGGNTVNNYGQPQQVPPSYSSIVNTGQSYATGSNPPPVPSKPNNTGASMNNRSDAPYSTPSVYNPGMYNQFGQNWKN